ncbi:hypothetical protein B0T16DRAFT_408327, partial [Cercophora newfieldiana]
PDTDAPSIPPRYLIILHPQSLRIPRIQPPRPQPSPSESPAAHHTRDHVEVALRRQMRRRHDHVLPGGVHPEREAMRQRLARAHADWVAMLRLAGGVAPPVLREGGVEDGAEAAGDEVRVDGGIAGEEGEEVVFCCAVGLGVGFFGVFWVEREGELDGGGAEFVEEGAAGEREGGTLGGKERGGDVEEEFEGEGDEGGPRLVDVHADGGRGDLRWGLLRFRGWAAAGRSSGRDFE